MGDVCASDQVDMSNRQFAQQIGIPFLLLARRAAASPVADLSNAHQTHQPSGLFATDGIF